MRGLEDFSGFVDHLIGDHEEGDGIEVEELVELLQPRERLRACIRHLLGQEEAHQSGHHADQGALGGSREGPPLRKTPFPPAWSNIKGGK